jgi:hypothetical protein
MSNLRNTKTEIGGTINIFEIFTPVEFAYIDYNNSWKKCRCGRITLMKDNWCPSCGQRLGTPVLDE